jgi:hypothetical protein
MSVVAGFYRIWVIDGVLELTWRRGGPVKTQL